MPDIRHCGCITCIGHKYISGGYIKTKRVERIFLGGLKICKGFIKSQKGVATVAIIAKGGRNSRTTVASGLQWPLQVKNFNFFLLFFQNFVKISRIKMVNTGRPQALCKEALTEDLIRVYYYTDLEPGGLWVVPHVQHYLIGR